MNSIQWQRLSRFSMIDLTWNDINQIALSRIA